ncbi:hypothetical protein L6164_031027 [Bauhinia variegata]|uniref:Uncharacterized protein n=1 Tax=Bauhinia variegata TaxID=167791 RepID=A0ACB9LDL6_BAUVA|nr:hypothetical protein L6164_031027 [Bauhinia variegata]
MKVLAESNKYPFSVVSTCVGPCTYRSFSISKYGKDVKLFDRVRLKGVGRDSDCLSGKDAVSKKTLKFITELVKRGIIIAATVCGIIEESLELMGVANAAYGVLGLSKLLLRNVWPKMSPAHTKWMEKGLVLSVLMGLSAFCSMADTSITALWPWKGHQYETVSGFVCEEFGHTLKTGKSIKVVLMEDKDDESIVDVCSSSWMKQQYSPLQNIKGF